MVKHHDLSETMNIPLGPTVRHPYNLLVGTRLSNVDFPINYITQRFLAQNDELSGNSHENQIRIIDLRSGDYKVSKQ